MLGNFLVRRWAPLPPAQPAQGLLASSGTPLSAKMGELRGGPTIASNVQTTSASAKSGEDTTKVLFAGCGEIRHNNVCIIDAPTSIRLWVSDSAGPVSIALDNEPIVNTDVPLEGGRSIEINIPKQAKELMIQTRQNEETIKLFFETEDIEDDVQNVIKQATAQRRSGDAKKAKESLTQALQQLQDGQNDQSDHEQYLEDQARLQGALGRTDLVLGNVSAALTSLSNAASTHHALGNQSLEAHDTFAAVHTLLYRTHDYQRAQQLLSQIEPASRYYPAASVELNYYRGLLALEKGDLREALANLRSAHREARRLGARVLLRVITQAQASVLIQLGKLEPAYSLFLQSSIDARSEGNSCEQARSLSNRGWVELLAIENQIKLTPPNLTADATQVRQTVKGAIDTHLKALAEFERHCPDPIEQANVRVGLARLYLIDKNGPMAEKYLSKKGEQLPPWLELATKITRSKISLLARNNRGALAELTQAETLARSVGMVDLQLEATVLKAKVLQQQGDDESAERHFEQAENLLNNAAWFVPLGENRNSYIDHHASFVFDWADMWKKKKNNAKAFELLRKHRTRTLSRLMTQHRLHNVFGSDKEQWEDSLANYRKERESAEKEAELDWKRPKDELTEVIKQRTTKLDNARERLERTLTAQSPSLPSEALPPKDEECIVGVFEGHQSTLLFAQNRELTQVEEISIESAEKPVATKQTGMIANAPVERWIQALRHVETCWGTAKQVRWLSSAGGSLVDPAMLFNTLSPQKTIPIVHSLDIGTSHVTTPSNQCLAAMVIDPLGNLSNARQESIDVQQALTPCKTSRWRTLQGEKVTAESLTQTLLTASWFHLAGHAKRSGDNGLDDQIMLFDGAFDVRDILTLPQVPQHVVLSSCEGAHIDPDHHTASIDLASAFILSGSKQVLAATKPVKDSDATAIVSQVYHQLSLQEEPNDLASALATAQSQFAQHQEIDKYAFRVFVP